MADYCEFSGLLADSCAHCKHGMSILPPVAGQDDRDWHGPQPGRGQHDAPLAPGRWFAAQWPGFCSGDHPIAPGDMLRADGTGGWECENCG